MATSKMTGISFAGIPITTGESKEAEDAGKFLIHGPQGAGKRLPIETPILTPGGWRTIGSLAVGDSVIGVDGSPYPVYGVTVPVVRPTYRVTLKDGGSVLADGEHLWEATNRKGNTTVLTTDQIREGLERGGTYTLPRMEAAKLDEAELPLDPYILGALLADGHLHGRTIEWTKNTPEVIREFESRASGWDYVKEEYDARRIRFRGGLLREVLENLNLRVPSAEKFIPEQYFNSSISQRKDLLAGLFDGDGRLSSKGQPLYHSTSYQLACDVQELCWSLGIGANLQKFKTDGTWRVGLTTTEHNPFLASGHREAVQDRTAYYSEARRIVSVESGGETLGRCIAVDSPRSLYVTKDYIVTHNTTLASTIARTGKTLFIDLLGERGTRSFRGAPYAKNIDVIRPQSVTVFDEIYWELNSGNHDYKAVVIDSVTSLQKMALRYLMGHSETAVREIKQGTAPADQRTWGESLNIMTDTATFWYSLADGTRPDPMHVVMTAQTKVMENELTGLISRQPDVQKGALQIMLASPDYVLYSDLEEDMEADSEDGPVMRHITRFGANPDYRTKARIPVNLRGKIPSILGRKSATDLSQLVRVLGIGGAQPPTKQRVKATAAKSSESK